MKNLSLIVWLTQLGLSVAISPAAMVWLAVWLRGRFELGVWVIIAGTVLGIALAINGFHNSMKTMDRMAKEEKTEKPPLSFNDHD